METNNVTLKVDFKIENPAHGQYENGVLTFVFDEKKSNVLKKIDFEIDGQKFYVNLLRIKYYNLTWIFQKERSLNALNRSELDKILYLANDVAQTTPLRAAYKNLLKVLPHQAEIYVKIMDKNTTKEEKRLLLNELKSKNNVLRMVVAARKEEISKNRPPLILIQKAMMKTGEKEPQK